MNSNCEPFPIAPALSENDKLPSTQAISIHAPSIGSDFVVLYKRPGKYTTATNISISKMKSKAEQKRFVQQIGAKVMTAESA